MENDARKADFANSLIIEGVKSPELWITLEELADLKGKQIKDLTIAELSITTWHEACDL